MKKKNIALAVILPMLFSSLGLLYSSITAGIIMIVINIVVLGIILAISGNIGSLIFFSLLLSPLVILWSVLVAKKKNELVDRNEMISSDIELNIGGDAFMQTLIVLFLTCGITALVCQFNETNILSANIYIFLLLEIALTIVISILPDRKKENSKVNNVQLND
jgi:hypothetical protein